LSLIEEVPDGQIIIGTPEADALGFMQELFYGNLWKIGSDLYVVYIKSYHQGQVNVTAFLTNLLVGGFTVHLVDPGVVLEQFAIRHGWKPTVKEVPFIYGLRTVWTMGW